MKLLILLLSIHSINYAIKPLKNYIEFPDTTQINLKTQEIINENNDTVFCWHYSNKNHSKKTSIILSYGDFGNMSYWIYQATNLALIGYDVITYDYRGFGKSSNFNINEKQLFYNEFSEDLLNVYSYIRKISPENKIGLLGYSMGSYINLIAAEKLKVQKLNVDFLISEGQIFSPFEISKKLYKIKNIKYTFPKNTIEYTIKTIQKKICPKILIFIGKKDDLINNQLGTIKPNKCSLIYYEGGHLEGVNIMTEKFEGDKYFESIENFING